MDHQYIQLPAKSVQEPSLSFPDGKNLLIDVEEASSAGLDLLPGSRNILSRTDSASAGTAQFLIPRKPVGNNQQTRGNQPVGSNQLVGSNQAMGKSQHSTPILQSTKTHARGAHIFKNWWMEISACFLFSMALVAITATLHPLQGEPLPKWPYQISVNTLISIYVVVLKGTVLLVTAEGLGQLKWRWLQNNRPLEDLVKYDQATRGPLGALNLLWRLRLRHPLSSAGALISFVILAVDPFTQQIIHYYDCSVPMNGLQATIPRANFYNQRDWRDWNKSSQGLGTNGWVDPGLQAAISDGIISPNGLVSFECLTGNCTFEKEYDTVGYCSSCTDVTKNLTIRSTIVKSNYTGVILESTPNSNGTSVTRNLTEFGITGNTNISVSTSLPSGLSVSTYPGRRFNLTAMGVFEQPEGSEDLYRVEIISGKQFLLFDPATGEPPMGCDTAATNDTWYCKGYGAASCSSFPCVRSYSSTIESGELHETRVSTSNSTRSSWGHTVPPPPNRSDPFQTSYRPYLGMVDTTCLSAHERQSLLNVGYHLDSSTRWLAYNLTFDPESQNLSSNASFPESMLVSECIYIIDDFLVVTIREIYLKYFLRATVEGDSAFGGGIENLRGSQTLQTIYNYGDVSFDRVNRTFQNISDSITSFFRQKRVSKYNNPAKGVVMHNRTCLSVQWAWLAFPSILVLLTLIFFVATIIDTRPMGNRAPVWKSSPLALAFHGLELPNRHETGVGDIEGMEALAKDMVVRLGTTEKGLKLVESENEHTKNK